MKPARGKGRGGGKGRGRGQAAAASKDDELSGSLRSRGRGRATTTKARKKAQSHEKSNDDWSNKQWQQEWEEEAAYYGSANYWDQYALQSGMESQRELEEEQEHQDDGNTADKAKKKKTNTEKTATRSEPSAASSSSKRKQESDALPEKTKRKKQNVEEQEPHAVPEATANSKDVSKIRSFMDIYKNIQKEAPTDILKAEWKSALNIGNMKEIRWNPYWKTGAVGCRSRTTGKDIAHFNFHEFEDHNYMSRVTVALKCCKLFVTRLQSRVHLIDPSTHCYCCFRTCWVLWCITCKNGKPSHQKQTS